MLVNKSTDNFPDKQQNSYNCANFSYPCTAVGTLSLTTFNVARVTGVAGSSLVGTAAVLVRTSHLSHLLS